MPLKRQHILYWLITLGIILLAGLLAILTGPSDEHREQASDSFDFTTSIDVTPGRYYQTDGLFHLDMAGTSKLILPIKNPPKDISKYPILLLENLASNQAINIYLTAQLVSDEKQPAVEYKQQLNISKYSVNPLQPAWNKALEITEVALEIESEISLGFGKDYDSQVSWQSIRFTDNSQIKPLNKWLNNLTTFVPLDFSSVNLQDSHSTHMYQFIFTVILSWLLICYIVYLIIKPAVVHFMASLGLAWIFVGLFYAHNFSHQIEFNQQRFADHSPHLNRSDQKLYDMANHVNQMIKDQNEPHSTARILIFGGSKFNRNRLNYHLLQHNVGLLEHTDLNLKIWELSNIFIVLLPPNSSLCDEIETTSDQSKIKRLINQSDYCLVHL